MSKEQEIVSKGDIFGQGLREESQYNRTQIIFEQTGLTEAVLGKTPPVGVNLCLLSTMESILTVQKELFEKSVNATMLGIAIPDGVVDFQKFLHSILHVNIDRLSVIDIDQEILRQIQQLNLSRTDILHRDARHTELVTSSQDIVIRDHLGNCCPPMIDRAVESEVARIVKPGGISIVNITTSESLMKSPDREVIHFDTLSRLLDAEKITELTSTIYDLAESDESTNDGLHTFRGKLLEIENDNSFVVFGEDEIGHGEWFRPLADHVAMWEKHGFEIMEIKTREGTDSHTPPLICQRHNVVMKKRRRV